MREKTKTMSIRVSDLFSFAWSYTSSRVVDYYRHYFSEVITVTTKSGQVKGYKIASSFDYNYVNFHGIPYAKPPVGDLRFKVCGFSFRFVSRILRFVFFFFLVVYHFV